jgi:hypothetical protein
MQGGAKGAEKSRRRPLGDYFEKPHRSKIRPASPRTAGFAALTNNPSAVEVLHTVGAVDRLEIDALYLTINVPLRAKVIEADGRSPACQQLYS